MMDSLSRLWGIFALRGILALLFGFLALWMPDITLIGLVSLFAAFALVAGGFAVYGAFQNRGTDEQWWLPLLWGLVSIGAGLIAVFHPSLSALILVLVIAANALISGALDIVVAIRLRKFITNDWLMALNGLLSILFGVIAFMYPGTGALALVWLIGAYAIVTGALLLIIGVRLQIQGVQFSKIERRVISDRRTSHAAV